MPTSSRNILWWEDSLRLELTDGPIVRRQGNSGADCTSGRLLSMLRDRITAPGCPDDPESAWSASSLRRVDVIPNGERKALAPSPVAMRCSRPRFLTERL